MEQHEDSQVVPFFRDQCVFLTGVTGLLGKVLLWKLYRDCHVKKIFVLVREKKIKTKKTHPLPAKPKIIRRRVKRKVSNDGEPLDEEEQGERLELDFPGEGSFTILTPAERLEKEVLSSPILKDLAQEERFKNTIQVVGGDVAEARLGMNESDRAMVVRETTVIIHGAATTNFNEPLKRAMKVNVIGVQNMLQLARECSSLVSFIHVSTAYVNFPQKNEGIVQEDIYVRSPRASATIDRIMSMGEEEINSKIQAILGPYPNTYTFTKNLGENLIAQEKGNLPIAIVRPSIIVAAVSEPFPGWVDSLIGPSGLSLAGALGVMRFMKADPRFIVDFIPVDYVVSAIVVAAWAQGIKISSEPSLPIYHITTSNTNPTTWYSLNRFVKINFEMYRPSKAVGPKPTAVMSRNRLLHFAFFYLVHLLPASAMDLQLKLQGKPPKFAPIVRRLFSVIDSLSPFTCNFWLFGNDNTEDLWNRLNEGDQRRFVFDVRQINWPIYYMIFADGLRRFILKEEPKLTWVEEGNKVPLPVSPSVSYFNNNNQNGGRRKAAL